VLLLLRLLLLLLSHNINLTESSCVLSQAATSIDNVENGTYTLILTIGANKSKKCTLACQITSGSDAPIKAGAPTTNSFTPFPKHASSTNPATEGKQHYWVFTFTSLKQYQAHTYSCTLNGKPSVSSAYTFPKKKNQVRIAAMGDWDQQTGGVTTSYIIENIEKYDAMVTLGDYGYDLCNYGNSFMTSIMPITKAVPFMVAAGNHEGNSHCGNKKKQSDYADYINRFNMPQKKKANNWYYSFDIGNVHFVSINTDLIMLNNPGAGKDDKYPLDPSLGSISTVTSTMLSWLKSDLAGTKQQWKVVYGHRPFYTSYYSSTPTSSDKNQIAASILKPALEPIFLENHVDFFIQADVHAYERLNPIKNGVAVQTGPKEYTNPGAPIYLVCGNAGEKSDPTGVEYKKPYISPTVTVSQAHGVCDFTFTKTTVSFQYINTDAKPAVAIDNFTLTKNEEKS